MLKKLIPFNTERDVRLVWCFTCIILLQRVHLSSLLWIIEEIPPPKCHDYGEKLVSFQMVI